jgi:hypothetical protein
MKENRIINKMLEHIKLNWKRNSRTEKCINWNKRKNSPKGHKDRIKKAKERISKLEDKTIEITKSEENEKGNWRNMKKV